MENNTLWTPINTSFDKQQSPLTAIELPCNIEYTQTNLGACAYFLVLDYPVDIEIYISMNPEFKNAFKIDARNTGFTIDAVYTPQGLQSMTKNVYLWTKGTTGLVESNGEPYKLKIVTSALPQFRILNNSAINSIESIGQIGRIDGLVGYPSRAKTICGMIVPQYADNLTLNHNGGAAQLYLGNTTNVIELNNISPTADYILYCEAIMDIEMVGLGYGTAQYNTAKKQYPASFSAHAHLGLLLNENSTTNPNLPSTPNNIFTICSKNLWATKIYQNTGGWYWSYGGGNGFNDVAKYQFTGQYLIDNFLNDDNQLSFTAEIEYIKGLGESELGTNTTNSKLTYQFAIFQVL